MLRSSYVHASNISDSKENKWVELILENIILLGTMLLSL